MKEIALALGVGLLLSLLMIKHQESKIDTLNQTVVVHEQTIKNQNEKISQQSSLILEHNSQIEKQHELLVVLQKQAEQSEQIGQNLIEQNKQALSRLKVQAIPKDCRGAADWTISQLPSLISDWKK